ncbi:MAG: PKD domain-containing protein [Bacteroidetes bacterium]|nr:PKD domain-containing protein [Bacteroidota bacterium]
MKKCLLPILLLCPFIIVTAQTTSVLFIGNSYTASNNLPQLFSDLALSMGDTVIVDSNTPGGYTFQGHTTNATTLAKINTQPWDFVFLQEQSQLPSFSPPQVAVDVYPYARMLDSLIYVNDSCTETVFYMTWGRKYGDAGNCANWPPVCTFTGMQQQLRDAYVQMANDNNALVAPVGQAWKESWFTDTTINLWVGDNSHPAVAGSYLTACVMYATIFRKASSIATFYAGLPPATAQYLQQIADQVVFDSLPVWNVGDFDVQSDFIYNANNLQVQFTDQSLFADWWQWDFGDGSVSALQHPLHTYSSDGVYIVKLLSGNSCEADSAFEQIVVTTTGQAEVEKSSCLQYLGENTFLINCGDVINATVYFPDGRRVMEVKGVMSEGRIDLNTLHSGIYLIEITFSNRSRVNLKWHKD